MRWPAHRDPVAACARSRAAADPGRDADRRRGGRADEPGNRAGGAGRRRSSRGPGYAYHHVISLIVVASTFAEGVRAERFDRALDRDDRAWPTSAMVVATVAPGSWRSSSGTGIAPAVAIMEFFVPAAGSLGLDPIRLGAVTALAAHFGRTMSPAAAVVMMSARLSGASPRELIRHVAFPLLIGLWRLDRLGTPRIA